MPGGFGKAERGRRGRLGICTGIMIEKLGEKCRENPGKASCSSSDEKRRHDEMPYLSATPPRLLSQRIGS